jgi:hypothetical protein
MNVGDTVEFQGIIYTIWLIENGIYHLINDEGNGKCGDYNWIMKIEET